MPERKGIVSLHGDPLTLMGNDLKEGDHAPDFIVLDHALKTVQFSSFRGKTCVVASVPSLDTPTCDIETRRFNQEAAALGPDVAILTISMDLPFAQKRWCGAVGVEAVQTFSDHRDVSFGMSYGVLIKELRLLARTVFVVDAHGIIRHIQIVPELSKEPDYGAVLETVKTLSKP